MTKSHCTSTTPLFWKSFNPFIEHFDSVKHHYNVLCMKRLVAVLIVKDKHRALVFHAYVSISEQMLHFRYVRLRSDFFTAYSQFTLLYLYFKQHAKKEKKSSCAGSLV